MLFSKHLFLMLLITMVTGVASASGSPPSTTALTIQEFFRLFGDKGGCGKRSGAEGTTVRVTGSIDCGNVFDRRRYPDLPYEKFMIRDENGKTLEVWVSPVESRQIFDLIYAHCESGGNRVTVTGKVTGFDMPIMGRCTRGYRIDLTSAGDVSFGRHCE